MRKIVFVTLLASQLADDPLASFRKTARPLIREYIFGRYEQFGTSELTFRHLKTHLAQNLALTYEALSTDEYQSIIEDETDKIANRCDGGNVERSACMRRFGLVAESGRKEDL
jgi:hypothetical protein|mmetsp:Transcript_61614/g.137298  ORF Transcript_61614/g.137298 Transcript_61614/m.137298 type:complete len:113 (+) Transcript_61614:19-357(+)